MPREPRRRPSLFRVEGLEPRSLLAGVTPLQSFAQVDQLQNIVAGLSDAPASTSATATTKPLTIAVVDTGVDTNPGDPYHVSASNPYLDLSDAYNAVNTTYGASAVVDRAPNDAGTRALNYVLQGISDAVAAGGSSKVEVVPVDVYDPSAGGDPFLALVGGIIHAADLGASVIDVGYQANVKTLDPGQIAQLQDAINYAEYHDAVVVAPAGDGFNTTAGKAPVGVNLDQPGGQRNVYPGLFHTANMLVVAATDPSGNLGGESDWGPVHVDLGAPVPTADRTTEFAASYAAGVAGVVAATRTDWSAIDVVNRIKATVQPEPGLAGMVATGGMISPSRALAGIASAQATTTVGDIGGDLATDFDVYGNLKIAGGYAFASAESSQGFQTLNPTIINNGGIGLGGPGSMPVSGDYYVGGVTNPAIWGPELGSNGQPDGKYVFAILSQDPDGEYYVSKYVDGIGGPGDIPVVADFTGSGHDDFGLYGYHDGQYNFQVLTAESGFDPTKMITINDNGASLGGIGWVPVVGDYFGDGGADPAVYGPELNAQGQPDGKYDFIALDPKSIQNYQYTKSITVQGFGQHGDIPIVGDYDGDGKSDLALYGKHGGQYNFEVLTSSSGFNPSKPAFLSNAGYSFGGPGAVPVSGDYFGDGGTDLAVYAPQYNSSGGLTGAYSLAALDLKSRNAQGAVTKSLIIPGFGGPTTIPDQAPPAVKYFDAQSGA